MSTLDRRTSHLARHRVSLPGTRYFVTVCTNGRVVGLTGEGIADHLLEVITSFSTSGDATLVCSVVMPDHLHWIFVLGERLALSQVVAKWKVLTARKLKTVGRAWQGNFFEHRIRPEEKVESYAFYVFMNPYAAGLVSPDKTPWRWWRKGDGVSFRFEDGLNDDGSPAREWLRLPGAEGCGISVGE